MNHLSHADKYLEVLREAGLGQLRLFPELGGGTHALGVENALGVHVLISQDGVLPSDDDEDPFRGPWSVCLYGLDGGFLEIYLDEDANTREDFFDGSEDRWVEVIRGALGYIYFAYSVLDATDRALPFGFRELAAGHILYSIYEGIEQDSNLQGASWEDFIGNNGDGFYVLQEAIGAALFKTGVALFISWSDVGGVVKYLYENNPILDADEAATAGFGTFDEGLLGVLKFTSDIPTNERKEVVSA